MYSEDIIEDIRVRTDIFELVSEYVTLEKRGKYYFGLCPFHREKTPSFSVTPDKQIFYCYGCGESGNVFHFIMKIENLDFVESVKLLAERAKVDLPERGSDQKDIKRHQFKQELFKLNIDVAKYFHANLWSDKGRAALDYLKKRGLKTETIRKFGLGYSLEGWNEVNNYLRQKGFTDRLIQSAGYIIKNDKGKYFDRFRGRLMFPIFDLRGKTIGFGGRVIDNSLPKYMNSPETPIYNKGKNLYALNFAKNHSQNTIIVVEGYMDVISLYQNGISNVVASLGTAFTESQGRLIKKYANDIVIAYDADAAGQAATLRGLDILNDIGCKVRVLEIPDGKDPDDFIRANGKDAFLRLVDEASPFVDYKLKQAKRSSANKNINDRVEFLNEATNILAKVKSDIEREIYIKKTAKDMGISYEVLYSEVMRKIGAKRIGRSGTTTVGKNTGSSGIVGHNVNAKNPSVNAEKILIWFLCKNTANYNKVFKDISINDFTCEHSCKIAGIITNRIENNKDVTFNDILNYLESKEERAFLSDIMNREYEFRDDNEALTDAINKIKITAIEKRISEIVGIIGSKGNSERDVEILKSELKSLITSKNTIESKKLG